MRLEEWETLMASFDNEVIGPLAGAGQRRGVQSGRADLMNGPDPAGKDLNLALRLNLYRSATLDVPVGLVRAADDFGYHSVWSAEAYGADALSPLAYLAATDHPHQVGDGHRSARSLAPQPHWPCTP